MAVFWSWSNNLHDQKGRNLDTLSIYGGTWGLEYRNPFLSCNGKVLSLVGADGHVEKRSSN